jgi:SAM-dependent methyltransferase
MPRIIDLSMALEDHFRWPVERRLTIGHARGDLSHVTSLGWPVHGFTHICSPRHFFADVKTTSDIPLETTVGEVLVDLTAAGAREIASSLRTTPVTTIKKMLRQLGKLAKYGVGPQARQREKVFEARVRLERFRQPGRWAHDQDFTRRNYASYDAYLRHQAAKLDAIVDRLRRTEEEEFTVFLTRFQNCEALREARSVLCLGARLGTEVKALHRLGYFAVGIDLDPGPDNCYVLSGDFHRIIFPDGSIDAIYTNALDHVFDLERMLCEVARLLRLGGLFIADIELGYEEGFIPGEFEATHWRNRQALVARVAAMTHFALENPNELNKQDRWTQVVLRKVSVRD